MWRKSFEIFDLNFLDCLSSCCYILLILWYWCAQNTKNNFDIRACALLPSEILVHNNRHDPGQTPDQNILEKSNFNTGEVQWSMTCWWKYFLTNQFIFFQLTSVLVLGFILCWTPYNAMSLWYEFCFIQDLWCVFLYDEGVSCNKCKMSNIWYISAICSCFWPFCWSERIHMVAFGEKIGHIDILDRLDVSYF